MKKHVGVLLGGMGSEREVSLKTGAAFIKAIQKLGYTYEAIDVGPDLPATLSTKKIDCALIALHGKYGEDGTVQGLLEYMKIPYTGSGVLASSLAMNKIATKQILTHWGVPSAEFEIFDLHEVSVKDAKLKKLKLPVAVKPIQEGSAVGVTIAHSEEEFRKGLELAGQFDRTVLVEKYIDGMELTVPIWMGKVLPSIEIVSKTTFYDYEGKYTPGMSEHIIPARLSEEVRKKCDAYALETFNAVGCRHYARVDMRVDTAGNPFILEINTLPGCTETSLFPESAAKAGITFEKVIETLIESATLDYR